MTNQVEAVLRKGVAQLPFALSEAQVEKILAYLALLNKWNAVHNLTAVRNPLEQVSQHVLDCLSVLPFVEKTAHSLADVGSGAGLPGVMLAMMRSQMQVFLVEAQQKKVAFLRQVKTELALDNVVVVAKRVEDWQNKVDVIISRAMAATEVFLPLTAHLGDAHSSWVLMKGPSEKPLPVEGFVIDAPVAVNVPLLQAARCVVVARKKED